MFRSSFGLPHNECVLSCHIPGSLFMDFFLVRKVDYIQINNHSIRCLIVQRGDAGKSDDRGHLAHDDQHHHCHGGEKITQNILH